MKPVVLIALGLSFAGVTALTFAQGPQAGSGKSARHAGFDTNGDGAIDRSEAAKAPKLAEHFDRLDANKDGRISADERPQRGMRGGRHGSGGALVKLDANADGVVDRSEAAKAPKLAEHFDRLDANKDGRISADERPQRSSGREEGGKGGRGERMAQLDTNGDGRFSRDELAGRERLLQNFAAIDGNRDGFVTREEMKAHHQARRSGRKSQP
jgi:Ca2+-binding EF-hand superfamily protein